MSEVLAEFKTQENIIYHFDNEEYDKCIVYFRNLFKIPTNERYISNNKPKDYTITNEILFHKNIHKFHTYFEQHQRISTSNEIENYNIQLCFRMFDNYFTDYLHVPIYSKTFNILKSYGLYRENLDYSDKNNVKVWIQCNLSKKKYNKKYSINEEFLISEFYKDEFLKNFKFKIMPIKYNVKNISFKPQFSLDVYIPTFTDKLFSKLRSLIICKA